MRRVVMSLALAALFCAATAQQWQAIRTWTGQGDSETESFSVQSREWRVIWRATETYPGAGTVIVSVYDARSDDRVAQLGTGLNFGFPGGSITDTSYVRGVAGGRYYIKVMTANARWTVTAEHQVPSPP